MSPPPALFSVIKILNELKLKWYDCQILLLNGLSSKVFHIVAGDGRRILTDRVAETSVVVKINHDRDRYEAEVKAITSLAQCYDSLGEIHYGLATFDEEGDTATAAASEKRLRLKPFTDRTRDFLASLPKTKAVGGEAGSLQLKMLPEFRVESLVDLSETTLAKYLKDCGYHEDVTIISERWGTDEIFSRNPT